MSDSLAALHAARLPAVVFSQPYSGWNRQLLGALCFGDDPAAEAGTDAEFPRLPVSMRRLDGAGVICEVWRSDGHVLTGRHGAIRYRHDGAVLFGVITLSEGDFQGGSAPPLQQATAAAYRDIFALVDTLGYAHLYRFWNYLPEINTSTHGLERYRQFNAGRQEAFGAHRANGNHSTTDLPAACALGSGNGPLSIAFLAGQPAPQHIENPRQVSAYRYPKDYGPSRPLFSRATLVQLPHRALLLMSGTASVVGHATKHVGDVAAQAHETIANIESVLGEANRLADRAKFRLCDLACRVYVRRPEDLPRLRAALADRAGGELNAVYLQADICRADLLLEIEGCAMSPSTQPDGAGE